MPTEASFYYCSPLRKSKVISNGIARVTCNGIKSGQLVLMVWKCIPILQGPVPETALSQRGAISSSVSLTIPVYHFDG
jgi:hypothetical protein